MLKIKRIKNMTLILEMDDLSEHELHKDLHREMMAQFVKGLDDRALAAFKLKVETVSKQTAMMWMQAVQEMELRGIMKKVTTKDKEV